MKAQVLHITARVYWPANEKELQDWAQNWKGEVIAVFPTTPGGLIADIRFPSWNKLKEAVRVGHSPFAHHSRSLDGKAKEKATRLTP